MIWASSPNVRKAAPKPRHQAGSSVRKRRLFGKPLDPPGGTSDVAPQQVEGLQSG
uniref:Uncharacterized protein n=1 Tax=Magnetospirillum gryphiswaldense TaxID=55518 RepID=A4TVJ5_9PROT|nr:hypothetical protein MGR_0919 [Magnetospirillum gryphiswaldense MSR-1]